MNVYGGNEWNSTLELNDFNQVGGSTEYDNVLINKDIDNYFNNLINKSTPVQNVSIPKSNYSFEKFYTDYIEHNLLFIVLLVGIIIFLIIRQYAKDYDEFDNSSNDEKLIETSNSQSKSQSKSQTKSQTSKPLSKSISKLKQIKKQQQIEKIQLSNYKKQLDMEKEKILTIIDELSNLNDYEYANLMYPNYLDTNTNTNNFSLIPNFKYYNQVDLNQKEPHNSTDVSQYYDVNKNQNDDINKVGDIYVEPPFN